MADWLQNICATTWAFEIMKKLAKKEDYGDYENDEQEEGEEKIGRKDKEEEKDEKTKRPLGGRFEMRLTKIQIWVAMRTILTDPSFRNRTLFLIASTRSDGEEIDFDKYLGQVQGNQESISYVRGVY